MKRRSTLLLRGVILLIGAGVLAAMIRFPQTEGRAADLDLLSTYADPLIIYGYFASMPFFFGLYKAFKLLGFVDRNEQFSTRAVDAVRNIKHYALAMPLLIAGGEALILINANGDDAAGPVALGIMTSFVSIVIAVLASLLGRLLQRGADAQTTPV